MKILLAKNLSHLRKSVKLSQEDFAAKLEIPRSTLSAYEEGRSEPPYERLLKIADFFHVPVDAILRADLSKNSAANLLKVGRNRLLFPVLVDKDDNDLIEVISKKAMAGYLEGYSDPQFIEKLPVMNLPFKISGKHRAFPIKGDSMPPLKDGSIVVGKFLETLEEIRDGQTYIVLTKDDGLVYKRLYKPGGRTEVLEFRSDNPYYQPYAVKADSILEVWSFVCSLNLTEFKPEDIDMERVIRFLQSYRVEMER